MTKEVWKDIIGFEGQYQISNLGQVKSLARLSGTNVNRKDRLLVQKPNKQGYLFVSLFSNSVCYNKYIHRLVAETFIPNPDNKPQVNHINEIKTDNTVENLNWMTPTENLNYGTRNEKTFKPVTNGIQIFKSVNEASEITGVNRTGISNCLTGRYKSSGGYHWTYVEKETI